MKTQGVRYLGSKRTIIPLILNEIDKLPLENKTAIDVFTGTTRVAQALRKQGFTVTTSDLNWASEVYSQAFICNPIPNYHMGPYVAAMSAMPPKPGWITENYCEAVGKEENVVNVWHPKNGAKADAIRESIENLNLAPWEKATLIASLIFGLDAVDNTVGLQQAYLKKPCNRYDKDLVLKLPESIAGPVGKHITGDCLLIDYEPAEVAYLDPPYTPADYSTYYHIWDSIAKWDKPEVGLKTNRRADRIKSADTHDKAMVSPWYKKKAALNATERLMDRLPVKYIVLSYSDEGLIKLDELKEVLEKYNSYDIVSLDYKRHVMSKIGAGAKEGSYKEKNREYIITIKK